MIKLAFKEEVSVNLCNVIKDLVREIFEFKKHSIVMSIAMETVGNAHCS
jgi:hypothetical protein